jgi:hypothetical protein
MLNSPNIEMLSFSVHFDLSLGLTLTKMHWLLGRQSKLSTTNKLLYKTILKPIWTYGIQLWGTASPQTLTSSKDSNRKPCA